ncbi:hypothetical protein Glove_229g55 [Diversispora epigaea]|uniref:Protein kinase domain-containing protein n=1 Tax=Diversispora epigaea TaxID=1348612 RepID=A0A397IDH8_9GLOM|nr:hypothetical protein Glove_229g55 [Diversispora epigaea]
MKTAAQNIKWNEKLESVWDKSFYSLDLNIYKTITEKEEHRKNVVKNDSSLTENEKNFLFNELLRVYDRSRICDNSVESQQCNNCLKKHQATQYCELCIRMYLENNFGNWTSENNEIDKLIQECQRKTIAPHQVIEWVEYDRFENVKYLTEGGCATIYTAIWKDGNYVKWDSERKILERSRRQKIVLKRLNNSNSNNVHWFQEVILNFTLDNAFMSLVTCRGLTKDPITQDYMLILHYYRNDLRHFLKDNYQSLTLLQKYRIILKITFCLNIIHNQNVIHRDLHSGNILYLVGNYAWYIGDLGLSGPVDKPPNSIYGNLPYIAPEVHCGEIYTKKSDIYSMGIIMWEVITGETPFDDREHDLDLTLDIVKGCRPKNYEYIPREYATLMKRCWDADPENRPHAIIIRRKMESLVKSFYAEVDKQDPNLKSPINTQLSKNTKFRIQNSKIFSFNIPIKPRNATDEEQLEMEHKSIEVKNSNKSLDDQEFEISSPSHSGSQFEP